MLNLRKECTFCHKNIWKWKYHRHIVRHFRDKIQSSIGWIDKVVKGKR